MKISLAIICICMVMYSRCAVILQREKRNLSRLQNDLSIKKRWHYGILLKHGTLVSHLDNKRSVVKLYRLHSYANAIIDRNIMYIN